MPVATGNPKLITWQTWQYKWQYIHLCQIFYFCNLPPLASPSWSHDTAVQWEFCVKSNWYFCTLPRNLFSHYQENSWSKISQEDLLLMEEILTDALACPKTRYFFVLISRLIMPNQDHWYWTKWQLTRTVRFRRTIGTSELDDDDESEDFRSF